MKTFILCPLSSTGGGVVSCRHKLPLNHCSHQLSLIVPGVTLFEPKSSETSLFLVVMMMMMIMMMMNDDDDDDDDDDECQQKRFFKPAHT